MWSIAGKTVLITGATNGIGRESAVRLAALGARVILVGRNAERLAAATAAVDVVSAVPSTSYLCDFASLGAVHALADDVLRDVPQLHVLINNAGSVFARRIVTVDGHEATFGVNHLAPFLLTQRLLPRLIHSAPARIITVASGRHFKGTMDFDDLGFERGYQILRAYARSKLANVLFATEQARRLAGTDVTSNSVHPGRVATNIWSGAPSWAKPLIRFGLSRTFITVEEGAAPVVALASRPDLAGVTGQYFDRLAAAPSSPIAQDLEVATRLWRASDRLVQQAVRT
jgi:retinol dehydrogenase-14